MFGLDINSKQLYKTIKIVIEVYNNSGMKRNVIFFFAVTFVKICPLIFC